jgi:indoleamine 2,3-dioxygenase
MELTDASHSVSADLARYEIDLERGFLPSPDPLDRLPGEFAAWEVAARELPKLLVTGRVRALIEGLPVLDAQRLAQDRERRRAMLLLSFLGHAYVWGEPEITDRLPACLAIPWYQVAQTLGRPPVLSYASYALDNWRRIDPAGPVALGNIALRQNFFGGLDEEWFILVHVAIEAAAASALAAIVHAQEAVAQDRGEVLVRQLHAMSGALEKTYEILLRMPECCDPYIYYNRVRPYIHGWNNHPALPDGLIYDGVDAYGSKPQKFRGETGAQSSIVPALDAALGIGHKEGLLYSYLMEMRAYMPPQHRAFIETVEKGPSVRHYVINHKSNSPLLRDAYNDCLHWLELFRSTHLEYAHKYILKQQQRGSQNPVEVGTGGTPFIPYLKKHQMKL